MDIYDLIDPIELSGLARAFIANEDFADNQFQLRRWFPSRNVEAVEFEFSAGTTRTYTDAMPFRGWTTEASIGTRPGRVRKSGQLPPLARKYMLTELDRLKIRDASRAGGNAAEAVQGDVYADVERGINEFLIRMEKLAAEILINGTATLAENGLQLTVDYGRDAARSGTVANAWSSAGAATPLDDEEGWLNTMEDDEGLSPTDLVLVSNRTTYRRWRNTDQVRSAMPTVRVPDLVTDEMVRTFRRDHDLPEWQIYNARANNVAGTTALLIPDDRVLLLPRNAVVGDTQIGVPPIADEPELQGLQEREGAVAYMTRQLDPLITFTHVEAVAFAVLMDPDATFSADVS